MYGAPFPRYGKKECSASCERRPKAPPLESAAFLKGRRNFHVWRNDAGKEAGKLVPSRLGFLKAQPGTRYGRKVFVHLFRKGGGEEGQRPFFTFGEMFLGAPPGGWDCHELAHGLVATGKILLFPKAREGGRQQPGGLLPEGEPTHGVPRVQLHEGRNGMR